MTIRTVLVLADGVSAPPDDMPAVEGVSTLLVLPIGDPATNLATRLCAAVNRLDPQPPLVVVAHGTVAQVLPSIALAQRSAHRRIEEYVLVAPVVPPVTDGWPDAPVTVVVDSDSADADAHGRLRGWRVLTRAQFANWRPAD